MIKMTNQKIIRSYYQKEHSISQKDFIYIIQLWATLVLFLEESKEKKKLNHNNLLKYFKASDLRNSDIYDNYDRNFVKNIF